MKRTSLICAAAALAASGCTTPIAKELRHPGGYPGHVLDSRMFDASDSKELQLLRATIILAMVARTGATSSDNGDDADTFVRYTAAAVEEINILAGHLEPGLDSNGMPCGLPRAIAVPTPSPALTAAESAAQIAAAQAEAAANDAQNAALAAQAYAAAGAAPLPPPAPPAGKPGLTDKGDPKGCFAYAVNFESDIKLLEDKLFKLALVSLPRNAAKRLLDDVANGDVLGSVFSAARFALSSVDGLRAAAGVQRTGLEIQAWQKPAGGKCAAPEIQTVKGAAECLGLPDDRVLTTDKVNGLQQNVPAEAMHALMRNIYDSCRLAPLDITLVTDGTKMDAIRDDRITACNSIKFVPRTRWVPAP